MQMTTAIQTGTGNIFCDACGYEGPKVGFDALPEYLDKPCPDCGENLLTRKSYEAAIAAQAAIAMLNALIGPVPVTEKAHTFQLRTTPDGKLTAKENENG
jgi:predicted RNA-binding Zn-ribbon protein involved in translation (DUF1610 family)